MKKYWKRYVILAISVIVAVFTFHKEIKDILKGLKSVSPLVIVGMVLFMQLYYILDGTITKNIVEHEHKITYVQGIACTYYCAFFRLVTLGSGSGVAQVAYLSQCGMDVAKASSIAMIQYVVQKFTIVILGIFSYIVFYKDINVLLGEYSGYLSIGVIVAFLIISFILIVASSKRFASIVIKILRKIGNKRFKEKIDLLEYKALDLQKASKLLFSKKRLLVKIFIINVIKLICMFIVPYILLHNDITLTYTIGLFAVSHMLAGVMPTPAGYGSLDLMFVLLYGGIVGAYDAALLIVLYRAVNTLFSYLIGSIVYMFGLRGKQQLKLEKVGDTI